MPLSKAKQAEYMRGYRQRQKGVIPSVIPKPDKLVIPNKDLPVIPNQDKLKALRKLMDVAVTSEEPVELIPFYNPSIHKAGDRVRMKDFRGKIIEVVVPELDGDGHPM